MNEQKLDDALQLVKDHYMPDEYNPGRIEKASGSELKVDIDVWWLMRAMQRGIGHCVLTDNAEANPAE